MNNTLSTQQSLGCADDFFLVEFISLCKDAVYELCFEGRRTISQRPAARTVYGCSGRGLC